MDWIRLMRAMDADEVMRIEELRELQIQKKAKPTRADWKKIQYHDELYRNRHGEQDVVDDAEGAE